MTAPVPLPPYPICKREPREWSCSDVTAWCVLCSAESHRPEHDHEIYVVRPTRAAARRAWRRIAR